MKKIVHIVGTGTIGEPLIGLFTDFGRHLGIDEVTFHKRTPLITERAKVNHLMERGARIAVDSDKIADFEALGHKVAYEAGAALERATVVIDCTPAGNENKKALREALRAEGVPRPGQRVRIRQDVRDAASTTRRSCPAKTASSRSSRATPTTSPA